MTDEIKQRIKLLNRGEIPEGYKKTQGGIVPDTWIDMPLERLLDFKNGINAEKEKFGTGIKLISVMDILDSNPITYDSIRSAIDIDENTLENYCVMYGDILFQRSSENFEDAGKSNVYLDRKTATYSGFVIRGKKVADYEPRYLNKLLKTHSIRKQVVRLSAGSQHINIGQESLAKIMLCMPDISEQEKIIEKLTKWDEAVCLQEKLIEKMEEQKIALMQQLLTPTVGWKKVKLDNVITIYNGYSFKSDKYDSEGNYRVITIANVKNNEFIVDVNTSTVKEIPNDIQKHQVLSFGDILMSLTGNVGRVCKVTENNCLLNQRVAKIQVKKGYNASFVFHCLQTYRFIEYMKMYAQGAAQDNLSIKDIKRFTIYIPENIEVQNKISQLLDFFDKNLMLNKLKLQRLKLQQKSMQQLLLTGIVRMN